LCPGGILTPLKLHQYHCILGGIHLPKYYHDLGLPAPSQNDEAQCGETFGSKAIMSFGR